MYQNKLFYLFFFSIIMVLSSCGGDEEDAKPAAISSSFTQDRKFIEPNESVNFSNSSTNAVRYEWNFGNGQTSTVANPSAVYTTTGTFTVRLTSYNDKNETVTSTSTVTVGNRYLTGFTITTLQWPGPGRPWDPNDGPDLLMTAVASSPGVNTGSYMIKSNVNLADIPLNYTITPATLKLTNEDWWFDLYDDDSPSPMDRVMDYKINPYTFPSTKDYETGKGVISLQSAFTSFNILYEIR